MTDYEVHKVAKQMAIEMVALMKSDGELLDILVPPRFMDFNEASEYTRIPVGTLRHYVNEIPHTKQGKRVVFTDRGLAQWMQNRIKKVCK